LALFGVAPDEAADWIGEEDEPECFGIWPENAAAFRVFMSMSTQWRWTGGMEPQREGLDYTTFDFEIESAGVKKKRRVDVFRGVKVMERAALVAWQKAEK
jgi:hypothetical protein